MKFKVKTKDCQLMVKVKTSFGESIDQKELDRVARIVLRGFLKPKMIKRNQVEYTGPVGVSLYDRLRGRITKRDFLLILEQVVVTLQNMNTQSMLMNYLVLDLQYAFINDVTKEVRFIYLPANTKTMYMSITDFIESIVYSANPSDQQAGDCISRFIYFFRGLKSFDIKQIEAFILKEDRSVVNSIQKQNSGQSGFMTDKQIHYYNHYDSKNKNYGVEDELTGLLADDEGTGRLEESDATGLLVDNDDGTALLGDDATGLLNDETDEATGLLVDSPRRNSTTLHVDRSGEVTGLLIDDEDEDEGTGLLINNEVNVHFASLYRVLTEETISVNKPVFRLGKERSYVDYFVTNNIAVSRSHADIITRGRKYFVIDLNSKNHTFINNHVIPIQCEIEIFDGDRLKLGNEEFIFHV